MIPKEWLRLYYKLKGRISLPLADQLPIQHHCLVCHALSRQRICGRCQADFFIQSAHTCTRCALPLTHRALLCGDCLQNVPAFDHTVSPYCYQTPLSELIIRFKDKHDFFIGKALSSLFCQQVKQHYVQQHLPLPDCITPVPQHWKKQGLRGFNHAAFFCHHLSHHLAIPIFTHVKRHATKRQQKSLTRQQRLRNLKQAFITRSSLKGQHVAIVDDVMTTGATANALAYALKKVGAKHVSVWALARTPKNTIAKTR